MEEFIVENIAVYGPFAVFFLLMLSGIGLSVSEDLIIIPAGVLVGSGELGFWPTLIASYIGVVGSDCLWFGICSRYGTPFLHKRWLKRLIHPRRLLEAKHEMERRGAWMIVFARFIPGSRTTAITVAGMLHMPFWRFAAVTAACVCLTAPLQIGLGVLIERGISTHEKADLWQAVVGAIMLVIAASMVLNFVRRRLKRNSRPPRAKVRWLKRFRVPRRRRHDTATSNRPLRGAAPKADSSS